MSFYNKLCLIIKFFINNKYKFDSMLLEKNKKKKRLKRKKKPLPDTAIIMQLVDITKL